MERIPRGMPKMKNGYKLFDKIIHPSKVAVGTGEPVEEPKEEDK